MGDKIKTGHENTFFLLETPGKEKVLFLSGNEKVRPAFVEMI